MSFALKELSRLLAPEQTVVGVVVGIDGAYVRVATERGAVTARTIEAVAVGDRVRIEGGMALRAPRAGLTFSV